MNAKLGQHLTLLGFCALIFYGIMLASGQMTLEILPQFLVTAVIFLSSGRIMRRAARQSESEEDEKPVRDDQPITDWSWLTTLLNWTCACLIIGIMAILLLKPIGLSWQEALSLTIPNQHYFAGAVP